MNRLIRFGFSFFALVFVSMVHAEQIPWVTDSEWAKTLDSQEPVLVEFTAGWCGPCKVIHHPVETVAREMDQVKVVRMDIDENPQTPSQYGIRGIPALLLVVNKEVIAKKVGARNKTRDDFVTDQELLDWVSINLQ